MDENVKEGKAPSENNKTWRTFAVRNMREENYNEFKDFCNNDLRLDFGAAIVLLVRFYKDAHSGILQVKEEEKPKRKKISTMGGGDEDG